MSIKESLETLKLESLEHVTSESLKQAFKRGTIQCHPDKGGKEGDFDKLLAAYLHVTSVLRRLTGGRDGLQSVLAVDEVEKQRENQFQTEMNNMINEVYDNLHLSENQEWNTKFNEQFEKQHVPHNNVKGYNEWLKKADDVKMDEAAESAIHSMPLDQWNQQFVKTIKGGKPPVVNHSKLAIFQAHSSYDSHHQHIGSALIERKDMSFTSYGWDRPAYTDLYDAYESESTFIDKLPEHEPLNKTVEDLQKERDRVFDIKSDEELKAIQDYEQGILEKKAKEEKENKERLTEYFKSASVSQWALRGSEIVREAPASVNTIQ